MKFKIYYLNILKNSNVYLANLIMMFLHLLRIKNLFYHLLKEIQMVKSKSIIEVFESSRDVADIFFQKAMNAYENRNITSLSKIEIMYRQFYLATEYVMQDVECTCLGKEEFINTYAHIGKQLQDMI